MTVTAQNDSQSAGAATLAGRSRDMPASTRQMLLLGLAALVSAFIATGIPPVPDHGYQFYLGAQLLDGARLYVDIAAADMHPPLFTWLAAALVAIGRLIGVDGLTLYPIAVCLTIAGALLLVWQTAPRSLFVLAVLVVALLPLAGPFFGQGEHLALILALPYLAALARFSEDGWTPATGRRLLIALAAGIGLAMKPHFALVWLGVEGYLAYRRGPRSLLRIESVTIGTVFVSYVLATALLTPEFFRLLPWLMELYPRFAPVRLLDVIIDRRLILLLAGLAAGRLARSDPRWTALADVLTITALAMFLALLLQKKGWGYHWYPVNALSLVMCGLALRRYVERFALAAPITAALAVAWMPFQVDKTASLLVAPPGYLAQMMDVMEEHAQGGSIQALTHTLNVGFPLVNFTHVRWASPYAHLWMIPAIYEDSWYGGRAFRFRQSGKWQPLEQEMFDRLWRNIEQNNPLLLVQQTLVNGFDTRAYFETDPRFRDRFARSPVLDTVGHYIHLWSPALRHYCTLRAFTSSEVSPYSGGVATLIWRSMR